MTDSMNTVDRLEELESRLVFQDDLVEQLNDVVARQDRLIADLQIRISTLEKRLEDLADGAASSGDGDGFEVPPHY
ncbi:MAG TPA: SlyX family protein [Xanthomonadales bacterium]|nr:SlyX family protein [Xanthomonadales bacterium]